MLTLWLCLGTLLATPEPAHAANPIYRDLLEHGATLGGTRVEFPAPLLQEGQSAAEQRQALRKVAELEERLKDLMRDSVTAPFLLKTRDETTKDGDLIRIGELLFFIHADLDKIDPDSVGTGTGPDPKPVEAGNMKFRTHSLTADELKARQLEGPSAEPGAKFRESYVHFVGKLLDRIDVEATDRIVMTRSTDSMVVASGTDPRFNDDATLPNRWQSRKTSDAPLSPPAIYPGAMSYVKISRIAGEPNTLCIEVRFAFVEPKAWFDGAPVLRSKLSLIAQERIRELRRELAKSRKAP